MKGASLLILVVVAMGCSGSSSPGDHVDAPEVKAPISQDKAMTDRGMTADEKARERAAVGASTPSGSPR